jgi:hypothetical protein
MLGVEPSTILKPQTARDLALEIAKFKSDAGGFLIPRAIALEVSPALLAARDISTSKYEKYHLLYSTRLSLATLRDSSTGQVGVLAMGARISVVDEKSLKSDQDYEKDFGVTPLTAEILSITSRANTRALDPKNRPKDLRSDQLDEYEAAVSKSDTYYTSAEKEELEKLWKEVHRRMAERYWNKTVFDLAVAARGRAADSTGRDLRLDALSAWASYSKGYGQWGQLLLGARLGTARDSVDGEFRNEVSLASRLYVGSRVAKVFAEVQATFPSGRDDTWLLNSGLQAVVLEWVWLDFSAGVEKASGGVSRAQTSFKIKSALRGF